MRQTLETIDVHKVDFGIEDKVIKMGDFSEEGMVKDGPRGFPEKVIQIK